MSWIPWGRVDKCWIHSACGGPLYMKFWLQFVFLRPLNLQGQILPNLIFCAEKRHISGKMQVPFFKLFHSCHLILKNLSDTVVDVQ